MTVRVLFDESGLRGKSPLLTLLKVLNFTVLKTLTLLLVKITR